MNPATVAESKKIAHRIKRAAALLSHVEVVMCPPFSFITSISGRRGAKHVHLGAQSASVEDNIGPFTGEVSAVMLRECGVEYVIIGHSERRRRGDTDEIVSHRLDRALAARLIPILCIGETVRDEHGDYLDGLKNQIRASCGNIPKKYAKDIVIAYEPVWAIGAQEAMKPEDMYETSLFIRKVWADMFGADAGLKVTILYGGSVTYRNAPDIMQIGKVDGLLVGRESVNAQGFVELMKAVDVVA